MGYSLLGDEHLYNLFYILAIVISSFWTLDSMAITEFTGEFMYNKATYGTQGQNSVRTRRYGVVLVQYIFNVTGIELNYTQLSEVVTENSSVDVAASYSITSVENKTLTTNYGIGLRQALAPYGSFITPSISLGYAKQIKNAKTHYLVSDGYYSSTIDIYHGQTANNAVFGTFSLRISLTRLMALTASVQTVFKAYEYNQAKNNITYTGGVSWIF